MVVQVSSPGPIWLTRSGTRASGRANEPNLSRYRGPESRKLKPKAGEVTALPAGGSLMIEMACHVGESSSSADGNSAPRLTISS